MGFGEGRGAGVGGGGGLIIEVGGGHGVRGGERRREVKEVGGDLLWCRRHEDDEQGCYALPLLPHCE